MADTVICRVLTTTACNAGCAYCYEKGAPILTMTPETAEQTAAFLAEQAAAFHAPLVSLEWFGGEPTLNLQAMDTLSAALFRAGVWYTASIVTNGLLADAAFTPERISLWQLTRAQITLDGPEKTHERVKGFAPGAYERIMENILTLTERKIRVRLRLNASGELSETAALIDELRRRFSGNEQISAYIAPLYAREKAVPRRVMLEVLELNRRLVEAGLASENSGFRMQERKARCFMMTEGGFTVAPDGRLFNCSHVMTEEQCVGSVWQYDAENPIRQAFLRCELSEECRRCAMLPVCGGGCRIAELGLSDMRQCHPYKSVCADLLHP